LAESHTKEKVTFLSAHHPALAHHFENLEQQREAGTLGMWVFLITEIMFFGGLFTAYIVYRSFNPQYAAAFGAASSELDITLGGINTAVLIGSSFTMVLAVYGAQVGHRRLLLIGLALTILLGLTFLGIKVVEYEHKIAHHLFPMSGMFKWEGVSEEGVPRHPAYARQAQMFFWIYFSMTGLHALHMIIGVGVMAVIFWLAYRHRFSPEYHAPVEISGLYWHFVDIVWIFLFPLLYLIHRHQ
jgi:cytochrome c oxidase subunit 3